MASKSARSAEDLGMEVIAGMDREFHDASDRIVAVVSGAYLDALLDSLLRAVFIDDPQEAEALLRPDAPLGSNGTRYKLAYCMGLITKEQRDDLRLIAKIRNHFAHTFGECAFNASPVREWCRVLQQPHTLAKMPAQFLPAEMAEAAAQYVVDSTATPRGAFQMTISALFGSLYRRITYVRRLSSTDWYSYDPDAPVGPGSEQGDV